MKHGTNVTGPNVGLPCVLRMWAEVAYESSSCTNHQDIGCVYPPYKQKHGGHLIFDSPFTIYVGGGCFPVSSICLPMILRIIIYSVIHAMISNVPAAVLLQ